MRKNLPADDSVIMFVIANRSAPVLRTLDRGSSTVLVSSLISLLVFLGTRGSWLRSKNISSGMFFTHLFRSTETGRLADVLARSLATSKPVETSFAPFEDSFAAIDNALAAEADDIPDITPPLAMSATEIRSKNISSGWFLI